MRLISHLGKEGHQSGPLFQLPGQFKYHRNGDGGQKKVRFRQSVNYLIPFLNEPLKTQVIHHTGRAEDIRHVSTSAGRPSSDDLSALEQVLRSLPEVNGSLSNQQLSESRIQSLEKEMEKLKKRMDQFYQFIVREFQKRL